MFEVGNMVVYGEIGVCRIQEIVERELSGKGVKRFYDMEPVYEKGRILAPVDNPNIMIRPVISRERAEELIDMMPRITIENYEDSSVHKLTNYYKDMIHYQDCEKLLILIVSIRNKGAGKNGTDARLGQTDRKYMNRAENLLYGELAVVLDIDREEVPEYIEKRVGPTVK